MASLLLSAQAMMLPQAWLCTVIHGAMASLPHFAQGSPYTQLLRGTFPDYLLRKTKHPQHSAAPCSAFFFVTLVTLWLYVKLFNMYLFTVGLSNLVGKHPGDRNPSSPGEILSEHLLCEWRLHESPLKPRLSAMLPKAGRPKATQNTKPIHLEPTWSIEAIRVILGGIGCKDVHSRVVCSTDGIGVDPGDHHVPIYEPVPAKETPEVIHPQGYKQGFHNIPSNDISCSAILPSVHPRDATRFRQLSYGKAKNNSRGTVKGTSKADEDKVIFLELYKKCLKKSIHERKKN